MFQRLARGWRLKLVLHESSTFVKFTQAGAESVRMICELRRHCVFFETLTIS